MTMGNSHMTISTYKTDHRKSCRYYAPYAQGFAQQDMCRICDRIYIDKRLCHVLGDDYRDTLRNRATLRAQQQLGCTEWLLKSMSPRNCENESENLTVTYPTKSNTLGTQTAVVQKPNVQFKSVMTTPSVGDTMNNEKNIADEKEWKNNKGQQNENSSSKRFPDPEAASKNDDSGKKKVNVGLNEFSASAKDRSKPAGEMGVTEPQPFRTNEEGKNIKNIVSEVTFTVFPNKSFGMAPAKLVSPQVTSKIIVNGKTAAGSQPQSTKIDEITTGSQSPRTPAITSPQLHTETIEESISFGQEKISPLHPRSEVSTRNTQVESPRQSLMASPSDDLSFEGVFSSIPSSFYEMPTLEDENTPENRKKHSKFWTKDRKEAGYSDKDWLSPEDSLRMSASVILSDMPEQDSRIFDAHNPQSSPFSLLHSSLRRTSGEHSETLSINTFRNNSLQSKDESNDRISVQQADKTLLQELTQEQKKEIKMSEKFYQHSKDVFKTQDLTTSQKKMKQEKKMQLEMVKKEKKVKKVEAEKEIKIEHFKKSDENSSIDERKINKLDEKESYKSIKESEQKKTDQEKSIDQILKIPEEEAGTKQTEKAHKVRLEMSEVNTYTDFKPKKSITLESKNNMSKEQAFLLQPLDQTKQQHVLKPEQNMTKIANDMSATPNLETAKKDETKAMLKSDTDKAVKEEQKPPKFDLKSKFLSFNLQKSAEKDNQKLQRAKTKQLDEQDSVTESQTSWKLKSGISSITGHTNSDDDSAGISFRMLKNKSSLTRTPSFESLNSQLSKSTHPSVVSPNPKASLAMKDLFTKISSKKENSSETSLPEERKRTSLDSAIEKWKIAGSKIQTPPLPSQNLKRVINRPTLPMFSSRTTSQEPLLPFLTEDSSIDKKDGKHFLFSKKHDRGKKKKSQPILQNKELLTQGKQVNKDSHKIFNSFSTLAGQISENPEFEKLKKNEDDFTKQNIAFEKKSPPQNKKKFETLNRLYDATKHIFTPGKSSQKPEQQSPLTKETNIKMIASKKDPFKYSSEVAGKRQDKFKTIVKNNDGFHSENLAPTDFSKKYAKFDEPNAAQSATHSLLEDQHDDNMDQETLSNRSCAQKTDGSSICPNSINILHLQHTLSLGSPSFNYPENQNLSINTVSEKTHEREVSEHSTQSLRSRFVKSENIESRELFDGVTKNQKVDTKSTLEKVSHQGKENIESGKKNLTYLSKDADKDSSASSKLHRSGLTSPIKAEKASKLGQQEIKSIPNFKVPDSDVEKALAQKEPDISAQSNLKFENTTPQNLETTVFRGKGILEPQMKRAIQDTSVNVTTPPSKNDIPPSHISASPKPKAFKAQTFKLQPSKQEKRLPSTETKAFPPQETWNVQNLQNKLVQDPTILSPTDNSQGFPIFQNQVAPPSDQKQMSSVIGKPGTSLSQKPKDVHPGKSEAPKNAKPDSSLSQTPEAMTFPKNELAAHEISPFQKAEAPPLRKTEPTPLKKLETPFQKSGASPKKPEITPLQKSEALPKKPETAPLQMPGASPKKPETPPLQKSETPPKKPETPPFQRAEAPPLRKTEPTPLKKLETPPFQKFGSPPKKAETIPLQKSEAQPLKQTEVSPLKKLETFSFQKPETLSFQKSEMAPYQKPKFDQIAKSTNRKPKTSLSQKPDSLLPRRPETEKSWQPQRPTSEGISPNKHIWTRLSQQDVALKSQKLDSKKIETIKPAKGSAAPQQSTTEKGKQKIPPTQNTDRRDDRALTKPIFGFPQDHSELSTNPPANKRRLPNFAQERLKPKLFAGQCFSKIPECNKKQPCLEQAVNPPLRQHSINPNLQKSLEKKGPEPVAVTGVDDCVKAYNRIHKEFQHHMECYKKAVEKGNSMNDKINETFETRHNLAKQMKLFERDNNPAIKKCPCETKDCEVANLQEDELTSYYLKVLQCLQTEFDEILKLYRKAMGNMLHQKIEGCPSNINVSVNKTTAAQKRTHTAPPEHDDFQPPKKRRKSK